MVGGMQHRWQVKETWSNWCDDCATNQKFAKKIVCFVIQRLTSATDVSFSFL